MSFDEIDIHRAFDEDEFCPYFQPVVELRTGQLAGFELLARWKHRRLGVILPEDFIPALEKCGSINELTRRMLLKGFAASPQLPKSFRLAVNLSPHQLLDSELPGKIAEIAERSDFSPSRLTIEVTESALLVNLPLAQSVARALKDLQCRLALDDFGTGYSSLKHLEALPFDVLKVDRSFVGSMTQSREKRKIVAAVVGLGRSLGLTTVAEGVETQEQANMLLWLGCDFGQGYFYSRPVPAEDLPPLISRRPKAYSTYLPAPAEGDPVAPSDALPGQKFAQLQAIYDGVPVGLALLDRNLRYVSLNRRLAQMNGAPIAAHLGRPITELVPDLYPQLEPFLRRALAGEAIPSFEVQRPNFEAGGGYRTLMLSYQPARDEAGEVVGVSIAVTDVSERKRIQQVLDETEEHYRSMLELNPQMPWVMDPEGKIIEVSPRLEEMTGLAREQLLGFGWLNMLHPDDMPAVRQALHSAIASGQSTDVQYRIRCRNGEWRWVRSRGYPRLDSSGKIVCRYGGLEDIQEQKQTQDALQACRAELRAISDAVPFGVVLAHAPEGNIVLANPAAKQWFGDAILPGQVIADYGRWGAFCADGQRLKPEEYPLACALLRGETTRMEKVFLRRADGTSIGAALSGVPVHSEDGRTIGGIMLIEEQGAEEKKE